MPMNRRMRKKKIVIFSSFFVCCLGVSLLVSAFVTQYWFKADIRNHDGTGKTYGDMYVGLFKGQRYTKTLVEIIHTLRVVCLDGVCMYSCADTQEKRKEHLRMILDTGPDKNFTSLYCTNQATHTETSRGRFQSVVIGAFKSPSLVREGGFIGPLSQPINWDWPRAVKERIKNPEFLVDNEQGIKSSEFLPQAEEAKSSDSDILTKNENAKSAMSENLPKDENAKDSDTPGDNDYSVDELDEDDVEEDGDFVEMDGSTTTSEPPSSAVEADDLMNYGLWVSTIVFLSLGLLMAVVGALFAVINTATTPVEAITGVPGLYLWNGLATLFDLLCVIMWAVQFHTHLTKNVLIYDAANGWTTEGMEVFGYSFWLVVVAIFVHVANIAIIFIGTYEPKVKEQLEAPETKGGNIMLY